MLYLEQVGFDSGIRCLEEIFVRIMLEKHAQYRDLIKEKIKTSRENANISRNLLLIKSSMIGLPVPLNLKKPQVDSINPSFSNSSLSWVSLFQGIAFVFLLFPFTS
jgi:hypothetical protein